MHMLVISSGAYNAIIGLIHIAYRLHSTVIHIYKVDCLYNIYEKKDDKITRIL